VARPRYPRSEGPLPPPLPRQTRPVGQLVAEAIRLYGQRFWLSVALGVGPASSAIALLELPRAPHLLLGTVLWAAALVGGSLVATKALAEVRRLAVAFAVALLVLAPFPLLRLAAIPGYNLIALALFALAGLAVPAALAEGLGIGRALRRGIALGRADFVHALGSLAALVIVIVLSGAVLLALLHGFGQVTLRIGAILAVLVLSPLFLLGVGLLYFDQAARVGVSRRDRSVRSSADGS
jgi:hypothetical protein